MPLKIAFLDRDGVLIHEPQDDFQVDSVEKLTILPGVIDALKRLQNLGYALAMVTNQNGVGMPSFPTRTFDAPQEKMLEEFRKEGIQFLKIFVCPHFPSDGCDCRKPKTGLVDYFLTTIDLDREYSFMFGDRETDRQFAENIGVPFLKAVTNDGIDPNAFDAFLNGLSV